MHHHEKEKDNNLYLIATFIGMMAIGSCTHTPKKETLETKVEEEMLGQPPRESFDSYEPVTRTYK